MGTAKSTKKTTTAKANRAGPPKDPTMGIPWGKGAVPPKIRKVRTAKAKQDQTEPKDAPGVLVRIDDGVPTFEPGGEEKSAMVSAQLESMAFEATLRITKRHEEYGAEISVPR